VAVFVAAMDMSSSIAWRAMPIATDAPPSARSPNTGNAYSVPPRRGRSVVSATERSAVTKTSFTAMSWLPVPRRPETFQVSMISTSERGKSMRRASGFPPAPSTMVPPVSHVQCSQPLAKPQRPVTRQPPGAAVPRPCGA
jgi:hypothetical protein